MTAGEAPSVHSNAPARAKPRRARRGSEGIIDVSLVGLRARPRMTARMQEGDGVRVHESSSRLYHGVVCLYKGKVLPPIGHTASGSSRPRAQRTSLLAPAERSRRPERR